MFLSTLTVFILRKRRPAAAGRPTRGRATFFGPGGDDAPCVRSEDSFRSAPNLVTNNREHSATHPCAATAGEVINDSNMSLALLPLKIILVTLDLFIALVTFQWIGVVKKLLTPTPMRSVPVADDESHRVQTKFKGNLVNSPYDGVTTLYELVTRAFKVHGARNCMAQREYLGQHSPTVKAFGPTSFRTYDQVKDASFKFGASLRAAGLVSCPDKATLDQLTTSCTLAIFENTCPEWMIGAMGAYTQSISVTTVYATLGIDAVVDSINAGVIRAILCNKKSVAVLLSKISDMPTLKQIIYTNDMVAPDENVAIPAAPSGVNVTSFEDFVNAGDTKAFPAVPPKPDTCAVIMYTSGSTGKPKGVTVTHKNVLSATTVIMHILKETDSIMCYLPLAHIFVSMQLRGLHELCGTLHLFSS